MELLTWLTIGYFVILVLTLAVGLIAILVTLMSVAKKLGGISAGLAQVEQDTAPLNGGVETLNGSLTGLAGGLMVAETSFASADGHLQETLDAVTVPANRSDRGELYVFDRNRSGNCKFDKDRMVDRADSGADRNGD